MVENVSSRRTPAGDRPEGVIVNTVVLANFPIAFLIFAAIVGIPLWLTFKRPDKAPHYGQPATAQRATALAAASRPAGHLATARQHAAARTPVPGRQHAAAPRTAAPGAGRPAREHREHISA
jgi:hypothetical protein